jgi:hypothetical protein
MTTEQRGDETRARQIAKRQGLTLEKMRGNGRRPYLLRDGHDYVFSDLPDREWIPLTFDLKGVEDYLLQRDPSSAPRAYKDWSGILSTAEEIVNSYETGVTLRQLFYQLVSRQLIENTEQRYNYLSTKTAEARRAGWFPDLIDQTSEILVAESFSSPPEALAKLRRSYRRDRTGGQEVSLYLGVEKSAIENQLWDWFGDALGVPILALGGYGSQSYKDQIREHVESQDRPAVLIYAGDHDASGDDIYRDLVERTDCWAETHRVALTREQAAELPQNPGKDKDTRADAFMERHGYTTNVQVEVDALDPDTLRALYQAVVQQYWDGDTYRAVMAQEAEERDEL